MPRRRIEHRSSEKKTMNTNASSRMQNPITSVTSRLESIGDSIIDELEGSDRDRLKHQLLVARASTTTHISTSPIKRTLQQVFADLKLLDKKIPRQYRTIGVGDNDVFSCSSSVTTNKLSMKPGNGAQLSTSKTEQDDANLSEKEVKSTERTLRRSMRTRNSKVNTSDTNEQSTAHVAPKRARKRRSSMMDNTHAQIFVENDNLVENARLDLHKLLEHTSPVPPTTIENNSAGKVATRRKVRSSVSSSFPMSIVSTSANDF